jgi:hypothetical protein
MFWMNKEDADGLLEDVAMLGLFQRKTQYYGPSAEDLKREKPVYDERSRNIHLALEKNKQWTITDNERKKLRRMYCQQFHLLACLRAALAALESVLQLVAHASGELHETVQGYAHSIMRKAYDVDIDRRLGLNVLHDDPRNEGAVWAHPMRSWYSALQSRSGTGPARHTDKLEATELESMLKRTEACLQQLASRQYGRSDEEQRQQRLDVAKAESVRLAAEILKLKRMFSEAQVKLTAAEYRNHDLSACVLAAMAALAPALDDQAEQTEESLAAVQDKAYSLMRQTYDFDIDKALASKHLLDDPRKDANLWTAAVRIWYR